MYDKPRIIEVFGSMKAVQGCGQSPPAKTGGFADVFIAPHPPTASVPAYEADE